MCSAMPLQLIAGIDRGRAQASTESTGSAEVFCLLKAEDF